MDDDRPDERAPRLSSTEAATVRFGPGEVGRVRRNPIVLLIAATPVLVALALFALGPLKAVHLPILFVTVPVSFLVGAAQWDRYERARIAWPAVEAGPSGLRVGQEFLPRAQILSAALVAHSQLGTVVRLRLSEGRAPVLLRVATEGAGERLVHALDLDTLHDVARIRAPSRMRVDGPLRWLPPLVGVAILILARAESRHAFHVALPIVLFLLAALIAAPSRLEVGTDGVLIRWLARERFIPIRDVAEVQIATIGIRTPMRRVVLVLTSGKTIELAREPLHGGGVAAVAEQLRAAMAVSRGSARSNDDAALLLRRGRSASEWLAALRELGAGDRAGYRAASVPAERLWRVLEDPAMEPSARAGAALALAPDLGEEGRSRLTEVAHGAAAPHLRIALEGIAKKGSLDDADLLAEIDAIRDERIEPVRRRGA